MPIVSIVALESDHELVVPIVSIVYTLHPIANLDVLASISSYHPVLIRNGNTCPMTSNFECLNHQP